MSEALETYDWKTREYRRIPGTDDWVTVVELGEGGWEWEEFKAFWSPSSRRFFWGGASGCSCSDWSESFDSAADFEDGDRDALLRAWETFAKNGYFLSDEDRLAGVSEIRAFKKVK